jgi:hypothetical protein
MASPVELRNDLYPMSGEPAIVTEIYLPRKYALSPEFQAHGFSECGHCTPPGHGNASVRKVSTSTLV